MFRSSPLRVVNFSKWWNVRYQETGERRRMFLKSTYSFFFSFLFFLLWSGSGISREVVSALNSRVDVTSLLVIVSTFFLVSPFVFSHLVHRKPEYLSLSTGSKFATPKSFQFWRDRFPLDTLLFIIFLFFLIFNRMDAWSLLRGDAFYTFCIWQPMSQYPVGSFTVND